MLLRAWLCKIGGGAVGSGGSGLGAAEGLDCGGS